MVPEQTAEFKPAAPVRAPRAPIGELWAVNKYLWLCLLFGAIYVPLADLAGRLTVSLPAAYGVLSLAVISSALRTYSAYAQGGFNNNARAWSFNIADAAIIALGIRITGGLHSELWLLFFVMLISESLYSSPWQSMAMTGLIWAACVAGTIGSQSQGQYWLAMAPRMFLLVVVARFGRTIAGDRERRALEVSRLREDLAATEERARIAREVHDGLGHALSGAILRLEVAQRLVKKEPEEVERLLKEEVTDLRAAWNEGRDLAFHLRPWEPDPEGLAHSLRRHLGRFAERTGILAELEVPEELVHLESDCEMALTRIAQEALTNVAKHSGAKRVVVKLSREGTGVRMTVEDDGRGLPVGAAVEGFGFDSMRKRAGAVGGKLDVRCQPGQGVTVEVMLQTFPKAR